jgi:WD40 repeat protein
MSHHNSGNANKAAAPINMQTKLNGVHTKAVWGARYLGPLSNNLVNIAENEYVVPVGCTFLYMDTSSSHNRKAYLAESHHPEALFVTRFAMSKDSRYFASAVKTKTDGKLDINIHIHHLEYRFHESFRPRLLHHTTSEGNDDNENPIEVTALCFSHDSQYLAIATDRVHVGILIFDQIKGTLFQTLAVDGVPLSISFHPNDSSKMCVTGDNNMVRFWRFTNKSAHLAPVVGLRRGNFSYSKHCWIAPFSETSIVIGSTSGFLVPIQNCEQRTPTMQAFGEHNSNRPEENAISQMLIKGDHIIVASPKNLIVLYEVRRSAISKGSGLTASLFPLACYRLSSIDRIIGLAFANRDSITSYGLVACTSDRLVGLDIITDFDLSGGNATKGKDDPSSQDHWIDKSVSREIYKFHAAPVHCVAFASRSRSFLTSSFHDRTVRIWDFDKPNTFEPCWMVESFAERPVENPLFIDFHPSGLQVVVANETEIKEFAISDGKFDLMRRFSVRTPFQGSNGVPVVVSQPVSMVKYSNGGHLLAVVAGRYVQLFHTYSPDFEMINAGDAPCRVVSLCDHISPITDIVFLRGDLKVITTSLDGSVYSWNINGAQRDKEFVHKGVAATHVVATKHHSKTCTIIACFESEVFEVNSFLHVNNSAAHRRKHSSLLVNGNTAHAGLTRRASGFLDSGANDDVNEGGEGKIGDSLQKTIKAFTDARDAKSISSNSMGTTQLPKQSFLAVWTDDISSTPTIVQLDMPARCIAVGRSGGNDRMDLCVVGFDDGRVLISALPLPLILVRSALTALTAPLNAAAVMLKRRKNSLLATKGNNGNSNSSVSGDSKGATKVGFGSHFASKESKDRDRDDNASLSSGHALKKSGSKKHQTDSLQDTGNVSLSGTSGEGSTEPQDEDGSMALFDESDPQQDSNGRAAGTVIMKKYKLEESKCRWQRLFAGSVNVVCFSIEGDWLLVGGDEGTLMMLATFRSFNESDLARRSLFGSTQSTASGSSEQQLSVTNSTNIDSSKNNINAQVSGNDSTQLQFYLMERSKVTALKTRLQELEVALEHSKKENELYLSKMLEAKEKAFVDMEAKLKKEIQKRDESIISSRKEYLAMKKSMTEEAAKLKKSAAENLSAMETSYEKKISQDALYMDRLKQAYDEYVLCMQLDMTDLNSQTAARVQVIEQERQEALRDAEKQKRAVLAYYEYLQQRNDEVLDSLEDAQADERVRMRRQLDDTQERLQSMQSAAMSNEVHHTRVIAKFEADKKHLEIEILRVNNDIDWANDRIAKLEEALSNATNELKIRSELVDRAETKASEVGKKAEDLEKIRKTLLLQLEALQRDIAPKDKELSKVSDRMNELSREYEVALAAIAEKEKNLEHKTQNLLLLQKQVRDLRGSHGQKESALHRSATLLAEFLHAMQAARFQPRKVIPGQQNELATNGNSNNSSNNKAGSNNKQHVTEELEEKDNVAGLQTTNKPKKDKVALSASDPHYIVSSLHLDAQADLKLRSLHDVLKNFLPSAAAAAADTELLDEAELARREQERHVALLHRNIQSLRGGLEATQQRAQSKIHNHLADNEVLLREVNALRSEVKALSRENHRLQATLDFRQTNTNVNSLNKRPHRSRNNLHQTLQSNDNNFNAGITEDTMQMLNVNLSPAAPSSASQLSLPKLTAPTAAPPPLLNNMKMLNDGSFQANNNVSESGNLLGRMPSTTDYSATESHQSNFDSNGLSTNSKINANAAAQLHNNNFNELIGDSLQLDSSGLSNPVSVNQQSQSLSQRQVNSITSVNKSRSNNRGLEVAVPSSSMVSASSSLPSLPSILQQQLQNLQPNTLSQASRSIVSLDSPDLMSGHGMGANFNLAATSLGLGIVGGGVPKLRSGGASTNATAEDKIDLIMQQNLTTLRTQSQSNTPKSHNAGNPSSGRANSTKEKKSRK